MSAATMPGVGSMATGSGAGGAGGGGKKPSENAKRLPASGQSKRELDNERAQTLAKLAEQLSKCLGTASITKDMLTTDNLKFLARAYRELGRAGWKSPRRPSAKPMDALVAAAPGSELAVGHVAPPLKDTISVNPHGGTHYFPCLLAASTRAAVHHRQDSCCTSCRGGTGPQFTVCVVVPGLFDGACLNCAWSNHARGCSFSTAAARPTAPATRPASVVGSSTARVRPQQPPRGSTAQPASGAQASRQTTSRPPPRPPGSASSAPTSALCRYPIDEDIYRHWPGRVALLMPDSATDRRMSVPVAANYYTLMQIPIYITSRVREPPDIVIRETLRRVLDHWDDVTYMSLRESMTFASPEPVSAGEEPPAGSRQSRERRSESTDTQRG